VVWIDKYQATPSASHHTGVFDDRSTKNMTDRSANATTSPSPVNGSGQKITSKPVVRKAASTQALPKKSVAAKAVKTSKAPAATV
jgi:cell division septation protein DedD